MAIFTPGTICHSLFPAQTSARLRPKRFVWRLWQSTSVRLLLAEAGRHLGMSYDSPPDVIFDSWGCVVESAQQMLPGGVYALAQKGEEFDCVAIDDGDLNHRVQRRRSSTALTQPSAELNAQQGDTRERGHKSRSDAYILYVFLNGDGLESHHFTFSQSQVEQGLGYLLGLMAKRFLVHPGKLLRMDGRRVRDVGELMCRGAYIICPTGQSYRATWYFLPDHAIDTR